MEDKRFHTKEQGPALTENSMISTLQIDGNTQIDAFVKLKKFESATNGPYTLVAFAEIDVLHKMITGRYSIVKLSEQRDHEEERRLLAEQEKQNKEDVIHRLELMSQMKLHQSQRALSASHRILKDNHVIIKTPLRASNDLETIEETFSAEHTPREPVQKLGDESLESLHNSQLVGRMSKASSKTFMSPSPKIFGLGGQPAKTKISVIVDWVSMDLHQSAQHRGTSEVSAITEAQLKLQNQMMDNFCRNLASFATS